MVENTGTLGWSRCIESMRVASKCARTKVGLGVACTKVNASLLNDS